MSYIFKKRNTYHLCVKYKGKRVRRSLRTSNKSIAKKLSQDMEYQILSEMMGIKPQNKFQEMSLEKLIDTFMEYDHNWKDKTRETYHNCFKHYLSKGYPDNPSYRAMVIRCLNRVQNWALNEGFIEQASKISGGNNYVPRTRVFNDPELQLILTESKPYEFRLFISFAYYTGARQGEIRMLSAHQVKDDFIEVEGKTGRRLIRLNRQASEVLSCSPDLWHYTRSYASHTFKKNARRLGIRDARFHDLRRTFGYNLIRQSMPIYQVSKLLGHKSVTTTEKHYAPLMVMDIPDFKL